MTPEKQFITPGSFSQIAPENIQAQPGNTFKRRADERTFTGEKKDITEQDIQLASRSQFERITKKARSGEIL